VQAHADYIITPARLAQLWQGPGRVYLLLDDATPPEPFLQGATVALVLPGQRLLVNQPVQNAPQWSETRGMPQN
jgi:hypothetical protein